MANVLQQMDEVGAFWATGTSPARSLPAPALVGSRIAVVTSFGDGGGTANVTAISDAGGTEYTRCKRQGDATIGCTLEEWSGIATSVNAGQNVVVVQSASGASADDALGIYEIGNPAPAQVFDATNTNGASTASVTVHDSGNVTPGTVDSVIIAISRGSNRVWTPDADFINNLTNGRTTLGYRQQAAIAATSYTVGSDSAAFACLAIVAFDAATGTGPNITDVDGDNTITSIQENWPINGTGFDTATVEIRQGAVEMPQTVNSGQTATQIVCNTAFDPSAPGNGPHLKYGAALLAVVNQNLEEDTQAITITVPAGRAYVDIVDPDPEADNRITAVADIATGDQLEIYGVVGGTIADVTVNSDATFDCAASVISFQVRCWDATDSTWGIPGTQTPGPVTPAEGGGVVGTGVVGSAVVGPLGVSP